MAQRLQSKIADVISVCDREADIYEYLLYKLNAQQRFVVRSMQRRCIEESEDKLYQFASELQSAGQKQLNIAQKGGRKARTATLDITYAPISVKVPANKKGQSLPMYYVGCCERSGQDKAFSWLL